MANYKCESWLVSPCCGADYKESEGTYCCNARISETGLCYECRDHSELDGYFCDDCDENFTTPVKQQKL